MAKVAFSAENVKKSDYGYPKIKLKKNEIARIVLLEDPEVEFVHNVRKPITAGGVPVMETKTRMRDGEQYEDYKYEFVARPICLGDLATLEAQGTDPKNCPVCEGAETSEMFSKPQRRFALHVVKYETQPGKAEVKIPFQASTLVWSFTETVFSKLVEMKQEWGDLRTHDIILKCVNENFQTYDMTIAARAEWQEDDSRKELIKGLMAPENLAPDLTVYCGSRKNEDRIGYDVKAVKDAWAVVNGAAKNNEADDAMSSVGSSLGGEDSLDDLLGGKDTPQETAGSSNAAPADSFEALMDGGDSKSSDSDIDSLLKGI